MSDELFQKAKDNLIPFDIYLRESKLIMAEGFDPKYYSGLLGAQFRTSVSTLETAEMTTDDDVKMQLFRVTMETGVRIVDPKIKKLEKKDSKEAKELVKAELVSVFILEYSIACEDIEQEALEEFADKNVKYHLWPFWREYILSTFQRTQMPRVTLPSIQV